MIFLPSNPDLKWEMRDVDWLKFIFCFEETNEILFMYVKNYMIEKRDSFL